MPELRGARSGPAKLATPSAVLVLLGLGLCGARFLHAGAALPESLAVLGMLFLLIGVVGLLIAALWTIT
jgi:hypothetical protein